MKKNSSESDKIKESMEKFEKEFFLEVSRYYSQPKSGISIEINEKESKVLLAEEFNKEFIEWSEIRSLADRRRLIFSIIDSSFVNRNSKAWQKIERLNETRDSEEALNFANLEAKDEDKKEANFWNALARTNFILTNYIEAENCCKKAMEIEIDNIRTFRILADIYHQTKREKEAHELYDKIISIKLPKDQEITLGINDLLGFEGDIVNSPIYALCWLKNHEEITEEHWEWATGEFYYSPQFRAEHAYFLISKGDYTRGYIKLLILTEEMPWFKEAVFNAYKLMDILFDPENIKEKKEKLKNIIERNNWKQEDVENLLVFNEK